MLLYLSYNILYTWQVVGVGAGLLELSGRAHPEKIQWAGPPAWGLTHLFYFFFKGKFFLVKPDP